MKKFFRNIDGTFKVINVSVFVFVLTFGILTALSLPLFLQDKAEPTTNNKTTSAVQSNDLVSCKNCAIEFYKKEMELAVGERVKIKDIIDLKDVDLINVSFSFDDKYLKRESIDGDYYLVTKEAIGSSEIVATYQKYTTKMTIKVVSDTVTSASFEKDIYYLYTGSTDELAITTVPSGASVKLVDFESDDEEVISFNSNHKAVAKKVGSATIKLKAGDSVDSAKVYVMDNMISVKLKVDRVYKEVDEYKHGSAATMNYFLAVKFEDKKNAGYKREDISTSVEDKGSISSVVSFDSVYSADSSTYIYKLVVKYDSTVIAEDNYSIITFKLPDGSLKQFKIYK